MSLALLQNGQLPVYVPRNILNEVIKPEVNPIPYVFQSYERTGCPPFLTCIEEILGFRFLFLPSAFQKLSFLSLETRKPHFAEGESK